MIFQGFGNTFLQNKRVWLLSLVSDTIPIKPKRPKTKEKEEGPGDVVVLENMAGSAVSMKTFREGRAERSVKP